MAQQLNIQDVNNIFQSIISEFKVLFDVRMKPIVDQIQFHSENYKIISSILKQMPEFKSIVSENEHLKKIEEEYKQLKNITTGIVLEVKEDNINTDSSEHNISKLYSELNLGSVINITQKNYSQTVCEVESEIETVSEEEEEAEAEAEAEAEEEEEAEAEAEAEAEEEEEEEEEDEEEAEAEEEEEAEAEEEDKPIRERSADILACEAEEETQNENKEVACETEETEEVEEEFFMIEIEGCGNFYTNDENNGEIYEITENDEVGNKVGDFKNGEVIMI